jgi:FtsZ-binding cell division protein ZapB
MTQLDLQQKLERAETHADNGWKCATALAEHCDNFQQQVKDLQGKLDFKQNLTEQVVDLQKQVDALAAENLMLKSGHQGFFSYGSDSGFEEHESAEKAIAAAESDIDYYRGDACDGWSEETDQTVWGVIMQRATMTGLRPKSEEDSVSSYITEVCDYTLLPNIETPATDAIKRQLMAEGLEWMSKKVGPEFPKVQEMCEHFAAKLRQPEEKCHE